MLKTFMELFSGLRHLTKILVVGIFIVEITLKE